MKTLTVKALKKMKPGEIFAKGFVENSPDGIYMTDNDKGRLLRWLACRGKGYHDWAIYCYWAEENGEATLDGYIQDFGQKVGSANNIKKLVSCEETAFELYRF